MSKGIGMLRHAKPFVSTETLIYIYQTLVQPNFDYCSMVWGNCGEALKEKLQKRHNRAARVITGDTYEIRSFDILKKLNCLCCDLCLYPHEEAENIPRRYIQLKCGLRVTLTL